jgi:hypothetical protein
MKFWILAPLFLSVASPAQSLLQTGGLYSISGTCSVQGPYAGQVQIQNGPVQRMIRYQNPIDTGETLEAVWTGNISADQVIFNLKVSTTMTTFNDFQATPAMLQNPVSVRLDLKDATKSFILPQEGSCLETWTRIGDASATPLWVNQRTILDATGTHGETFLVRFAESVGIRKVINWYRSQDGARPWAQRPEFKNQQQLYIEDYTDLDFYQKNPQVLRVTDRWVNPISIAEAKYRRNAFSKSAEAKAAFSDQETERLNLNEAGLLEFADVDAQGNKTGFQPDYDSALWTGMYGLSLSMRYKVTQDPKAYQLFKRVLKGMMTLVDITGQPNQFARTLMVSPASAAPVAEATEWFQGTGNNANLKWRRTGNNDMIKGILLMFILADSTLEPSETALRSEVAAMAPRLLKLDIVNDHGSNQAIGEAVNAIWTGDHSHFEQFDRGMMNLLEQLTTWIKADQAFYVGGIYDFSGVHLNSVSNILEILAARGVQKHFTSSPDLYRAKLIAKDGEDRQFRLWKTLSQAQLKFLTVLTAAFSPSALQDSEFRKRLQHDLMIFNEFPVPRVIGTSYSQVEIRPEWCLSAWPRTPWKGIKGLNKLRDNIDFENFKHSAYAYPLYEGPAWSNYIWKDAQGFTNKGYQGNYRPYYTDYLVLYWTAKGSGLM